MQWLITEQFFNTGLTKMFFFIIFIYDFKGPQHTIEFINLYEVNQSLK